MKSPDTPGAQVSQEWSKAEFTQRQMVTHRILVEIGMAAQFGYEECRMATPGRRLPQDRVESQIAVTTREWQMESGRQIRTRGLREDDLPYAAWEWLTEVLQETRS